MSLPGLSRRRALSGAASVGVTLPLLAACGDDGDTAADADPSTSSSAPSSSAPPSSEAPSSSAASSSAPPTAEGVAATGDVPVGGGVVVADQEVVVTQPTAGEFKVFTAVCTHQGCLVGDVSDTINCPCHGSTFDIATGEPTGGPASSPLDPVDFEVAGDQVVLS